MSKRKKDMHLDGFKLTMLDKAKAFSQVIDHMVNLQHAGGRDLLAWSYVIVKNMDFRTYNLSGAQFFKCKFVDTKLGEVNGREATFRDCEVDNYQKTFGK